MPAPVAQTVSVIIPAHNAAGYVGRAIESALTQTHPPLEILVVDDGSTDHTAEVVEAYESAVRLVSKPNGGPATARNLGARLAQGEWLGLLDADDWWEPNKLSTQLEMATTSKVGLIHCLPDHRNEIVPSQLSFEDLWQKNWIINSSVLIRRDVFEALGGFDEAKELISVEDYNLWLRVAASRWRIVTCPHILVHYSRGIGISADSARFMEASLYNIETLQQRLKLTPAMVRRRLNDIIFGFGRQALYERDLSVARKLLWQAFADRQSPRTTLYLIASLLPESVLDLRRHAAGWLHAQPLEPQGSTGTFVAQPDGSASASSQAPERHMTSRAAGQLRFARASAELRQPLLVTTADAEEDFDWKRPFSRNSTTVGSMRSQHLAHRVFERFGVVPTYMVDYPVASKAEGRGPLLELLKDGHCDIGAQLHPWVTPPFVERLSSRNSYQGNLPAELELAKMRVLSAEIENGFGVRPRIFRAGRYGVGRNTAGILHDLGYQVDSSVLPCWNFRHNGGPDFRRLTAWPYWIDRDRRLLELPISAAFVGRAAAAPQMLSSLVYGRLSERLKFPAALARLGLLERIKLTPEGIRIEEAKRLVHHMYEGGHRIFVLTYHTPSLEIGNTPYVKSQNDLDKFLGWIEEFLEFFVTRMNGKISRYSEVHDLLQIL